MMAFVPEYEHDIFVSYAHVDDEPLPGADEGWVTTLIRGLEIRLAQRLGRREAFSVWMDHQLARHIRISPQIQEKLRKSALLLVFLSPGYVASTWCQREKDSFLSLIDERKRDGSGIFVVEQDRLEERPAEFRELKGYPFWSADRSGKTRSLGIPRPKPEDREYYDMLTDLAYELAAQLQRLKAEGTQQTSANQPISAGNDAHRTVFLAEVTDDLDPKRDEVKRYLTQSGVTILPEAPYPRDPEAFHQALDRDLRHCEIFVQLLSGSPGKKSPDLPQGYAGLQHELALAAGKVILQWRSRDLDPRSVNDKDHQHLLEASTVLATGLEEFKREIRQRALAPPEPAARSMVNAFVFVNNEQDDRSLASRICAVLEKHGAGFVLPLEAGSPKEIREDLERNLLDCDALIVIYGQSTVRWVREQLRQCRKVLFRRERTLKALAVVEGPPEDKDPLGLRLPDMTTLDCRQDDIEEKIARFVDEIGSGES